MPEMSSNLIANRYEVFKHIGQGGMADVFLAVDTILNRQVAIKILRSDLSTDAVSVLRFEREAQAVSALNNPYIVEIYDVGEYKGHHYIVMEYVPGKSLKEVIQARGALPIDESVDIMKQMCSGVAEAHHRGIIHRDLKPQNVIVKADGNIKILDFGIAIAKGSIQLTQANNVMGSVHYLAPELVKGEPATVQSDIYALGIVLFEMLTGDVPFKADSAVQVALMQMRNPMPDPREINPTIPQSVANIIMRATAKDKENRYKSCYEMLEDLRTCLLPERRNEPKLVLRHISRTGSAARVSSAAENRLNAEAAYPAAEPRPAASARPQNPALPKKKKKKLGYRILQGVLIAMLAVLGCAGIYFALSSSGILNPRSSLVTVPDLIGQTVSDARTLCSDVNLVLDTSNVTYTLTEDTPKGEIIESDPAAGEEVEKGTSVSITVSSGIYAVAENFIGQNINAVQERIANASETTDPDLRNLVVTIVEDTESDAEAGIIVGQELLTPGTQYNPDTQTEIRLIYAAYPTITIPDDVIGKTVEEASAELEALGAKVYSSNLEYSSLPEEQIASLQFGVVIRTDPEVGTEYTQREDNYITIFYY